jgi:hypothetical protein
MNLKGSGNDDKHNLQYGKKLRTIKCFINISGIFFLLHFLTGCAAGSATAGYSLKAKEADYLSASGEQRITERVKREVILELGNKDNPYIQPGY